MRPFVTLRPRHPAPMASGTLSPRLREELAADPAAAISAWLVRERPIDPDAWSERVGFTDGAHVVVVDVALRDGRYHATLGLDYQAVINLGCSVQRQPRRTWLALVIDPEQGRWSVAPRFAEDDEPEF